VEAGLAEIGLDTADTAANFSWISLGGRGADIEGAVVADLEAAGIVVRPGKLLGAPGRLRISYGNREENDRMLAALADSVRRNS
jgi:histidinol-phosphate aminotransferase